MTTAHRLVRRVDEVLFLAEQLIFDLGEELGVSTQKIRRPLDDVRRALDEATDPEITAYASAPDQRTVPYPIPEAAGNMFRSQDRPPTLCSQCGKYWPPAGKAICARCDPLPPEPPKTLSDEARAEQQKTVRAIQGVPQNDYGRS
jgi:hypothetical protein